MLFGNDDGYAGWLLQNALGNPARIPDPVITQREHLMVPPRPPQQSDGIASAVDGLGGILGPAIAGLGGKQSNPNMQYAGIGASPLPKTQSPNWQMAPGGSYINEPGFQTAPPATGGVW